MTNNISYITKTLIICQLIRKMYGDFNLCFEQNEKLIIRRDIGKKTPKQTKQPR